MVPYAFSFAMRSSWLRQSNAFHKSFNKTPIILPLSIAAFHFSSKFKRHCWVLYSFLKLPLPEVFLFLYFLSDLLIYDLSWFMKYADLRHEREVGDLINLFMFFHKISAKISTFSSECNGTRTQSGQVSLAKWLSVRLWTKWLWVPVPLQSLKLQVLRLFRARSSLTFRQI